VSDVESVHTPLGELLTAAGVHKRFGISEEVTNDLTCSGFMPHYKVKGISEPLYRIGEIRTWLTSNLVEHYGGDELPKMQVVTISDTNSTAAMNVPHSLSAIQHLRELRPEIFCGIYFLCLGDQVVYVGQSKNIMSRVVVHNTDKKFDRVLFFRAPFSQLDELEQQFIRTLCPPLNVAHNPVAQQSRKNVEPPSQFVTPKRAAREAEAARRVRAGQGVQAVAR
jgi:hypothetical protein